MVDYDEKSRRALLSFVQAVESTGGLCSNEDGQLVPVADPEWVDLACAYLEACLGLGKAPVTRDEVLRYPGAGRT